MNTVPMLRHAVVVLLLSLAPACDRGHDCPTCGERVHVQTAAPAAAAATTTPAKQLAPWETYDTAFNGCAGGCGMRLAGPTEGVIPQPGAMLGQRTYCLVSGVAFEIKATSVVRQVGDKIFYFCCAACAGYFTANQNAILAARGIAA